MIDERNESQSWFLQAENYNEDGSTVEDTTVIIATALRGLSQNTFKEKLEDYHKSQNPPAEMPQDFQRDELD